jgi:probable selenium-dependent hydroxylase accessory protein YqeC
LHNLSPKATVFLRLESFMGEELLDLLEARTGLVCAIGAGQEEQPLSERIAHRIDIVEAVAGLSRGETLQPMHIARLLASGQGLLKGVGAARVVPVINMVDDPRYEALALEAAHAALALTLRFDRVVLASMRRPDAVVRVVYR